MEKPSPATRSKDRPVDMDTLIADFGKVGWYHVFVFLLMCMNIYPVSLNYMAMTFYGATPKYNCKLPEGWKWPANESFPPDKMIPGQLSQCQIYIDPDNQSLGTEACTDGYQYKLPGSQWPIAAEWDLVCDKAYLVRIAQTLFFTGVMVGAFVFGYVADFAGRRPVVLGTLYGQAFLGCMCFFADSLPLFIVLKFLQGMLIQGLQTANNTLVMEVFETKHRVKAGIITSMLSTSASMVMALLAYLAQDWRYMQLTISLPTVFYILHVWFLPESFRWLVSHQRLDEAKAVALKFATASGLELPSTFDADLQFVSNSISANKSKTSNAHAIDLVKTPNLRRHTLILSYCCFAASVVYYGTLFLIPALSGNQYVNLFISGAMETVARFFGYFIIDRIGRRSPLCFFYILSGIFAMASVGLLSVPIDSFLGITPQALSTILALLGKASVGQCFSFLLIFSSELFPTVLRTIGIGTTSVFTRIGSQVAPQLLILGDYTGKSVPLIIFGAIAILAGLLILLTPETKGKGLPNTVLDAENVTDAANDRQKQLGMTSLTPDLTPGSSQERIDAGQREVVTNHQRF